MRWADGWNTSIKLTSRERLNSGAFWDGRTGGIGPSSFSRKLTDEQLAVIRPGADERIIEIGPGNGRLTIPLARSALEVTAVDPSANMLRILSEKMSSEGLTNLRLINDYWDRMDLEGLGQHQKLVSSFSLFMYGADEQMRRMDSIADAVHLFVPADIRIPFSVQEIMFGRVMIEHTDFEILYNIAKELGFEPSTSILEYGDVMSFESLDAALEHCFDLYNVPEPKKEPVADHLSSAVTMRDGKFVLGEARKVGTIWWQKR